ncbi:putative phosphatase [bioreactor metagenome]|uniref:Putative phosphatase n=1 Tax=bioreactor metagenome TaxID=1076179 RepID=A0A645EEZ1_9ZZZZ
MGIEGPVINYGGAIIMDTRTDRPIYTTQIPGEMVQDILSLAANRKMHVHLYQGDAVVYEKPSQYSEAYVSRLGLPHWADPAIRDKQWQDVPKILIITEDEKAKELIPVLQKKYAGKLKISGSSAGYIEFNHVSAHKGSAAAILAEQLGISPAQTVAVGDNSLDMEMIQWAGLGCAVGNAQPDILAAADLVLPTCGDMAVAHLIDTVLLKG